MPAKQDIPFALPSGYRLGNYTIVEILGHGGFGVTYLAKDTTNGGLVVIKENLPKEVAFRDTTSRHVTAMNSSEGVQKDFEWAMNNFRNEAAMLKALDHPNIVKLLQYFKALGTAYYVMPYMGKETLGKWLRRNSLPGKETLVRLLLTILSTLEYLHGKNLLHRDIKPVNIIIQDNGEPVLIDFGTVRQIVSERTATKVGSPGYTPFEQRQTNGNCGPWTDLYALGATFYRVITGNKPPDSTDRIPPSETPIKKLAEDDALANLYGKRFLASIDKALEMAPEARWQTASEWIREIKRSTGGSARVKTGIIAGACAAIGLGVAGAWCFLAEPSPAPAAGNAAQPPEPPAPAAGASIPSPTEPDAQTATPEVQPIQNETDSAAAQSGANIRPGSALQQPGQGSQADSEPEESGDTENHVDSNSAPVDNEDAPDDGSFKTHVKNNGQLSY